MRKRKDPTPARSNTEIRRIVLQYFYDRNANATSERGKRGLSVKISDVKRELRIAHGLSQSEVQSNLTYLISQGWVEKDDVEKEFTARGGTKIPSTTTYYKITAAGIDKIEGPGEFTMQRLHGVKIEATGQNIITVGDGNQVNAKFGELAGALAALRDGVTRSDAPEATKLELVADIETIQAQLAKPAPSRGIIRAAWDSVKAAAAINGCAGFVAKAAEAIAAWLP